MSQSIGRRCKEDSPDELHVAVLTGRTKKIKHLVKKGKIYLKPFTEAHSIKKDLKFKY